MCGSGRTAARRAWAAKISADYAVARFGSMAARTCSAPTETPTTAARRTISTEYAVARLDGCQPRDSGASLPGSTFAQRLLGNHFVVEFEVIEHGVGFVNAVADHEELTCYWGHVVRFLPRLAFLRELTIQVELD